VNIKVKWGDNDNVMDEEGDGDLYGDDDDLGDDLYS
jgi:hypothetical protein